MQEELERQSVAILVKSGKVSAQMLAKAVTAAGRKLAKEQQNAQPPHGRQSVKTLMGHGVSTSSIPLTGETKLFDRVARKWNVDYAFYKTAPGNYLLFFKSGQADAITACFSEYTKRVLAKEQEKRPSILHELKRHARDIERMPHELDRQKEVVRHDR